MPRSSQIKKTVQQWRRWVVTAIALGALFQIIAFTPVTIDEGDTDSIPLDPKRLLLESTKQPTIVPGIPSKIPDYAVENFTFSSVQGGEKQWRLISKKSHLFSQEKLVHSRTVKAYLYDTDEKTTVITGSEARYFLNQQDLEIFGDVKTVFPDGFVLLSPYLRYKPREKKIEIPRTYAVSGFGEASGSDGQDMEFKSRGFDYAMGASKIILPEAVTFVLTRKQAQGSHKNERTEIQSDRANILRDKQMAEFTMSPFRLPSTRFVIMTQPTLYARSRRAEVYYGDHSKDSQLLHYMSAFEDVLIKEKDENDTSSRAKEALEEKTPELRYSTSGRADFDNKRDVIFLREFPQVYQGQDTITGDVVIMHKDSDLVEVENSNAFNRGQ